MKSFTFIFIFLNILFCNCKNLRNLLLTMDPKKLETLMAIANKSLYQLLGVTMDFKGRGYGTIENQKAKVDIALYDDQEIPTETKIVRFEIKNWVPQIPEINTTEIKLDIFDKIYDIKEEYKIIANLFANSIQDGFVINYMKTGDNLVANTRFKCFVNTPEGNGSFEIAIQDKNEGSKILKSVKNVIKNITLDDVQKFLEILARASAVLLGVKKDWFSSSSFLNLPYLTLLLIFGLL